MHVRTSGGLVFAALFAGMLYSWLAANDWDMATVVGAIVAGYVAALHLALRFVQRWARQMAA
jgi:fructose-specific phosphotransferase system IIC component